MRHNGMKRTLLAAIAIGTALLVGTASPAAGLSCMEPEPFDMLAAIADADAAAVGRIVSITEDDATEFGDATLTLRIEVTEVFKGGVDARLTLVRHQTIWGPYYDQGQDLALLITDGQVDDGRNSLCGPFYTAEEMRQAGGDPSEPETSWLGRLLDLLFRLFD